MILGDTKRLSFPMMIYDDLRVTYILRCSKMSILDYSCY